jgi:hypothetical protein
LKLPVVLLITAVAGAVIGAAAVRGVTHERQARGKAPSPADAVTRADVDEAADAGEAEASLDRVVPDVNFDDVRRPRHPRAPAPGREMNGTRQEVAGPAR